MFIPSFQSIVDALIANIGWGTVLITVLTGLGGVLKLLWTLTTNHAEHIQVSANKIDQKTDTLIALAQAQIGLTQSQNALIANMADASKDSAVALAEIKTLLSVK